MKFKNAVKLVAVFAVAVTLAAACSSDKSSSSSASSGAPASSSPKADFKALGGWDDGACNTSLPKVEVGNVNPIQAAGISLPDYADGTQAAVDAFNKRGGIKGRCLDLQICDSKNDGPTELACVRNQTSNQDQVATLASTYSSGEADAFQLIESAGLPQIGAQVTMPNGWNSPLSYEFTMGGSGTLLADIPALKNVGVTKFVVFAPQSGQSGALKTFADPLIKALGMDLVDIIEIPPTAVEFTQFVQQAQNDGAEGIVLGLPADGASQIIDAMDSLNSPLKVAGSWGTFSQKTVQDINEDIAKNTAYSDAVPPLATDLTRWPIYNVILDDFKASGKANLTQSGATVQSVNGWLSVYALVKVMRDAGATDITRATVKQAFDQAQNVPMFDLMPPWTPSKQSANAIFKGISNPNYWTGHWDPDKKQFTVDDKQVDILSLLG